MIQNSSDLREFVIKSAEGENNPYLVARKILDGLTLDECRVVAETCFSQWVCDVLRLPHARPDATAAPSTSAKGRPVQAYAGSDGVPRASNRQVGFIETYSRYRDFLNKWVKVGDKVERKRFRDCTSDDLRWMADYRRRIAASNAATADVYEKLEKVLADNGAKTVEDLSPEVGSGILKSLIG